MLQTKACSPRTYEGGNREPGRSLLPASPVSVQARERSPRGVSIPLEDEAFDRNAVDLSCFREVNTAVRVSDTGTEPVHEIVAVESSVAIAYNGVPVLASALSPKDLVDYAYGMSFTAGIIEKADDIVSVDVAVQDTGIELQICLRGGRSFEDFSGPVSSLAPIKPSAARGSARKHAEQPQHCGGGGPVADPTQQISPDAIWRISETLLPAQRMHQVTGATHAAVFADFAGGVRYLREDVGRHNAVEKLIGALLRDGVDPRSGFVYLSSRCALELVLKCARYGIAVVATVSAPTSAVLDFAEQKRVTLCAFSRGKRFTIYTHPERIALG